MVWKLLGKSSLVCRVTGGKHVSSRGIPKLREGILVMYDRCERCKEFYLRDPTEEEKERYFITMKEIFVPEAIENL